MRLTAAKAVIGPTNLRSWLCSRKSACPISSNAPKVFSRRVISPSDSLDEDCNVAGLLDRLNDAIIAYRPGLRDHLKNALLPTIHHQTRLHDTLRDKIDTSFATGVLSADQVCKNVESFRLKDEDDVTSFYSGTKVGIYSCLTMLTSFIPREG